MMTSSYSSSLSCWRQQNTEAWPTCDKKDVKLGKQTNPSKMLRSLTYDDDEDEDDDEEEDDDDEKEKEKEVEAEWKI